MEWTSQGKEEIYIPHFSEHVVLRETIFLSVLISSLLAVSVLVLLFSWGGRAGIYTIMSRRRRIRCPSTGERVRVLRLD